MSIHSGLQYIGVGVESNRMALLFHWTVNEDPKKKLTPHHRIIILTDTPKSFIDAASAAVKGRYNKSFTLDSERVSGRFFTTTTTGFWIQMEFAFPDKFIENPEKVIFTIHSKSLREFVRVLENFWHTTEDNELFYSLVDYD